MTTFIITCVLALSLQFPANPTVAVILRDQTLIMRRSEAEAWYKVVDPVKDQALHVALTHALGTIPMRSDHPAQTRDEFRQEVACWWCPVRE